MKNLYRLATASKGSRANVVFSEGIQEKLSQLLWGDKTELPIDSRFVPKGVYQPSLDPKLLEQLDYISAFTSVPLFSVRLINALRGEVDNGFDYLPCKVVAEDESLHDFFILRTHVFLPLINWDQTRPLEKKFPLAPVVFTENHFAFLLARDSDRRTMLVASEEFKVFCQSRRFNITFSSAGTSIDDWITRQPNAIQNEIQQLLAAGGAPGS